MLLHIWNTLQQKTPQFTRENKHFSHKDLICLMITFNECSVFVFFLFCFVCLSQFCYN